MWNYLASSASSPASTTHTRQLSFLPSSQQRQLQIRRRLQQHKLATGTVQRVQHQSKSDPSSSDEGLPPPIMHHRVATGLHMAHTKTIAPAGLISEAIEMKSLEPTGMRHRNVTQEDSVKTFSTLSPNTLSTDIGETTLSMSMRANTLEKDESIYKRSKSYHGKGSVPKLCLSLL